VRYGQSRSVRAVRCMTDLMCAVMFGIDTARGFIVVAVVVVRGRAVGPHSDWPGGGCKMLDSKGHAFTMSSEPAKSSGVGLAKATVRGAVVVVVVVPCSDSDGPDSAGPDDAGSAMGGPENAARTEAEEDTPLQETKTVAVPRRAQICPEPMRPDGWGSNLGGYSVLLSPSTM
jgi:hypothetical protein